MHGTSLFLLFAACLFHFLAWVCQSTSPEKVIRKLEFLASLYWRIDVLKRKNVTQNLTVITGSSEEAKRLTPLVYREFAFFIYEFFSKRPAAIENRVEIVPYARQALGPPGTKPSLILMGHYGNWEIALQHLLELGYPVCTISMHHSHPKVDSFFQNLRQHPKLKCHHLNEGIKPILKAIEENYIVALACERDYTRNGYALSMFGQNFSFPKGPAFLMKKFKLPAFVFSQERLSLLNFKYGLIPLTPAEKQESMDALSQRIAKAVFGVILKKPQQWLTFDPYFSNLKSK